MTTLSDLFAVNGQDDDQSPWDAADDCESIDIRGEDLVVLCEDGVARWDNSDREWYEVTPAMLIATAEEIRESGRGGHDAEAKQFMDWMTECWDLADSTNYQEAD